MRLDEFAGIVEEHVPGLGHKLVEVDEIKKGGSDRNFFRLRWSHGDPIIAVQYPAGGKDNLLYVQISGLLRSIGINAPKVIFHDSAKGVFGMEDLGASDLWDSCLKPWEVRLPLYQSALRQVHCLHRLGLDALEVTPIDLHPGFDADLYWWEQGYFFDNCLGLHFSLPTEKIAAVRGLPELANIVNRLSARPRVLVHRDFQSQNIMVRDDRAWLIDFQGVREGLAQYDLASLLYDPYVTLSAAQRTELIDYYLGLSREAGIAVPDDFEEVFRWCAIQRLMQALGAYGFLGHGKKLDWFLQHIPAALVSLKEVVGATGSLGPLAELLDEVSGVELAGGE